MTFFRTATLLCLLCLLCLLPPALATAGSRISYRNLDGAGSQTVLVGAGRIRIDADSDNRILIDPAKGTLVVLHLADRDYLRVDRASLQRWVGQLNALLGSVDDVLVNVPPELRGGMQDLLGGSGGAAVPSFVIVDSGRRDNAAGHACTLWRGSRNGEAVGDACIGDVAAWELDAADRATANAAIRLLQDFSREFERGAIARYATIPPLRAGQVPLRISYSADGERGRWELAGSDAIEVDAGDFAIPAGFREKALEAPALGR